MGKLAEIGKVILRIYANDHLPPHFHIVGTDEEALVEIETMAIMVGALPRRYGAALLLWAKAHRDRIVTEWNRINPRFPIQ